MNAAEAAAAAALARDADIVKAWDANAGAWAEDLRGGRVPGRAAADQALMKTVREVPTGPVLDAGCGEGWLVRALAEKGHRVTGIDGSEAMVKRALEGGAGRVRALSYADAAENPRRLEGPYGTIVFNFSLDGERITPILDAAARVLFPYGRVLIHTRHPAAAEFAGPEPYRSGWREDSLAHAGLGLPAPVPAYVRTLATWILELRRSRLILTEIVEPLDPDTGRPVSLLLNATIPEKLGK